MKVAARVAVGVSASMLMLGLAMADSPKPEGMMGKDHGEHCEHGKAMHDGAMGEPAKRAEKRLNDLKAKLKLTPAQTTAWQAFADKMGAESKDMGATREKMWKDQPGTSPERMAKAADAMKERAQTMADMAAATKSFYEVLTPEQKATFDKAHNHYQKY